MVSHSRPPHAEVMHTLDVKRAIDATLPLVRDRIQETDREHRLPDDLVDAVRRTGLNRVLLPTVMDGLQAPVVEVMDILERIATVDGSTAWCAMIGAGSNVFAGYLPESGARRVFADPGQGSASMFAPAGRLTGGSGRLRLSGRWPFASNVLHSVWIALGALAEGPQGLDPRVRIVFVETSALSVEKTWDTSGLRGTGSHHVAATAVAVDDDHCCTFDDQPWPEGVLWRLPLHTVLIPLLAAVPLGVARGALDHIAWQAAEGRTARRGQLADDPIGMDEFAVADTRLRAARAALRDAVGEAHLAAEGHQDVDRRLRARLFLAALQASDVSVEVTSTAHQLGGGAAAYRDSPLLRALDDVHAARQHLLFAHKHRVELGKALAGLEVRYPPFLP
jgi:alkylation response protein AidB-like acyl-CoA dehydrogenase